MPIFVPSLRPQRYGIVRILQGYPNHPETSPSRQRAGEFVVLGLHMHSPVAQQRRGAWVSTALSRRLYFLVVSGQGSEVRSFTNHALEVIPWTEVTNATR